MFLTFFNESTFKGFAGYLNTTIYLKFLKALLMTFFLWLLMNLIRFSSCPNAYYRNTKFAYGFKENKSLVFPGTKITRTDNKLVISSFGKLTLIDAVSDFKSFTLYNGLMTDH